MKKKIDQSVSKEEDQSVPKEEDQSVPKEKQLITAVQNRSILENLEQEGLSLGELQYKVGQTRNEPAKKTTVASRINRLKTAGLVRKQSKKIDETDVRSPQYRGWRIKQQENGSFQAELGFELTENGKEALNTIRTFTEQKNLPQKSKTSKNDEEEKKNE